MRKVAFCSLVLVLGAPAGAWAHCHGTGYVAFAKPCMAPMKDFATLWTPSRRPPTPAELAAKWVKWGSLLDFDGNLATNVADIETLFGSPRYQELLKSDYLVDTTTVNVRELGDSKTAIIADWDATIGVDFPHHGTAYIENKGTEKIPDYRFVAVTLTPLKKPKP